MATKTSKTKAGTTKRRITRRSRFDVLGGLSKAEALEAYRTLVLSRRLDDREINLRKKNRLYFQISGAGHELPLICVGRLLDGKKDWFFPYYRDRALALTLGVTPTEILLQGVGAADDPSGGGRQMPSHWGHPDLHIPAVSSCTGTQMLHAAGAAQVRQIVRAVEGLHDGSIKIASDELVYVSVGDGTTSQGEFWEAMNTICNLSLPVLIMIEDNGYAISVPVEVQTPGGNISRILESFPNLRIFEFDGCDLASSHENVSQAVAHVRSGAGPAVCHAHVVRPYSHSLSDNQANYRSEEELEAELARDPFHTVPQLLIDHGIATEAELAEIRAAVEDEVERATEAALASPLPSPSDALTHVYSETIDPTSAAFDSAPAFVGDDKTMVDLLNACLHDEMRRDPRIVVFGEDVADASRSEYIGRVKGKGGVFKTTLGLQAAFGDSRVFNAPLAEANIIGRAVGMALRGLKPVVEIQFFDYIWPAYMQLRNELANYRWRSNGAWPAPVVVRVPIGGYLTGGAPYHSQSGEVLFTHIPGLRVVMPSNAADANGLLRTAIRCEDPVMFLEPKHLYRQTYNKSPYPGPDYMIPFGKARTLQSGDDVTLITYGCTVHRALRAARALANEGIETEVIDLRTLQPYDFEAIAESVKRTGKALVVHEDHVSFGYGAEIAARIADELFEWLDGPVRRLCGKDSFVAYSPVLEDTILPQVPDIERAIRDLAAY